MANNWTEHPHSRQATKADLVDIARAIGIDVTDRYTVPELRAVLHARIEILQAAGRFGASLPQPTHYCNVAPPPAGSSRDTDS